MKNKSMKNKRTEVNRTMKTRKFNKNRVKNETLKEQIF